MLKEAGRQLQEEVDRQLSLWGTEEWKTGGTSAADPQPTATTTTTVAPLIPDEDDPDAMMALFFAKQKAKQEKAARLPVTIWARNIVWLSKQPQQSTLSSTIEQPSESEKEESQRKAQLVDHLCHKFREYQAT